MALVVALAAATLQVEVATRHPGVEDLSPRIQLMQTAEAAPVTQGLPLLGAQLPNQKGTSVSPALATPMLIASHLKDHGVKS